MRSRLPLVFILIFLTGLSLGCYWCIFMKKSEGDICTPKDDEKVTGGVVYHLNTNPKCTVKTCEATYTLEEDGTCKLISDVSEIEDAIEEQEEEEGAIEEQEEEEQEEEEQEEEEEEQEEEEEETQTENVSDRCLDVTTGGYDFKKCQPQKADTGKPRSSIPSGYEYMGLARTCNANEFIFDESTTLDSCILKCNTENEECTGLTWYDDGERCYLHKSVVVDMKPGAECFKKISIDPLVQQNPGCQPEIIDCDMGFTKPNPCKSKTTEETCDGDCMWLGGDTCCMNPDKVCTI